MLGQRGGIGGGRNGGRVKSRRTVAAQVGGPALLPQSSIASNCVTASAALIVVTESQKAQMGEKNQKPSAHGDRHGRGVVVVGNPASEHHHDARRAQLRTVEISAATEAEVLGLGYARSSFLRTRRGAGLSCWTENGCLWHAIELCTGILAHTDRVRCVHNPGCTNCGTSNAYCSTEASFGMSTY